MARGMGVPHGFMVETLNKPECELVYELLCKEYLLQVEAGDMPQWELDAYLKRLNKIVAKIDMGAIEATSAA